MVLDTCFTYLGGDTHMVKITPIKLCCWLTVIELLDNHVQTHVSVQTRTHVYLILYCDVIWFSLHVFKQTRFVCYRDKYTCKLLKRKRHAIITIVQSLNMMTSSNGNIFRVTGHLCGEFTGPGEFPTQRPVTRSFDVYFDLRPNKWLSKQSWGWWFETLSCSLWRHRNELLYKVHQLSNNYPAIPQTTQGKTTG